MAVDRSFCPHCYAPVIAGRKNCPKCGRNVSDAPPSSPGAQRGATPFTLIGVFGALVVVISIAAWVFLR